MTVNEAHLIYFSPTHTSKQVAEAIVHGTGIKNILPVNVTLQTTGEAVIPASALAIIVVPVYGGRVAPLAMERLQNIRGLDTPTVLVVVYGNRAYEKALMELDAFALPHGLKVIAGATFIGEHSYSTDEHPIAAGRPNDSDLALATECTHCGLCVVHCPAGAITKGDELNVDETKCIKCCACVKVCPRNAKVYDTPFAALLSDCFKKQKQPQTIL